MIYEIIYLFVFFFGGRYILDVMKNYHFTEGLTYQFVRLLFFCFDLDFTDKQIFMFIKFIGVVLFCIAVFKFFYKISKGEYKKVKLNENVDKNNKIYQIISKMMPSTWFSIVLIWFLFMIPSPIYFVMNAEKDFIYKCFFVHLIISLWFALLTCKHGGIIEIRNRNIFYIFLNDYSEVLKMNNGVKTDEAVKIEQDAVYLRGQIVQAAKAAGVRAAVTSAGAFAAGTYAGKKIGDAIVKNKENYFAETVIKDGKEVKVSKSDVFAENLKKELSKL